MFTRLSAFCAVVILTFGLLANAAEGWPDKLRFGIIPVEGSASVTERFGPLLEHLSDTLGVEVEAFTATDYAGIITAMQNKHIELAYFGPKSYTEASLRAGAEAVALEQDLNGNPGYYGILISHKDSGIDTFEKCKGKVFAFTDPNSTSGCLVPNVLFYRDKKVKPEEYFKEVKFSGSHNASILAVANQDLEVAATNNIDMGRAIEAGQVKKDQFIQIWQSELIPGAPMCIRKDMPKSLKAAFCGALMMFNTNEEGLKKLAITGYKPASDKDYDVIRYLKRLKEQLQEK